MMRVTKDPEKQSNVIGALLKAVWQRVGFRNNKKKKMETILVTWMNVF